MARKTGRPGMFRFSSKARIRATPSPSGTLTRVKMAVLVSALRNSASWPKRFSIVGQPDEDRRPHDVVRREAVVERCHDRVELEPAKADDPRRGKEQRGEAVAPTHAPPESGERAGRLSGDGGTHTIIPMGSQPGNGRHGACRPRAGSTPTLDPVGVIHPASRGWWS